MMKYFDETLDKKVESIEKNYQQRQSQSTKLL